MMRARGTALVLTLGLSNPRVQPVGSTAQAEADRIRQHLPAIRRALFTPANVHDTIPADALVMGDEGAVYADKAYATHARRAALKARGIKDRIMHRPNKHHRQLPSWQARRNALIQPIRAAIERTFGTLKRSYGYRRVRYYSLAANAVEFQLKCIAFNLRKAAVLAAG
jgi:IS5 family transposase